MELLEIEIQTKDLEQTEIFYADILCLKLIKKTVHSISFQAGASILNFSLSDEKPLYHFAFNIPNNKLNEAILWSNSRFKLIEVSDGELIANFETWKAKSIYFLDNNNNILEFIARYDLNNESEKPFNSTSILSISEIGIVDKAPSQLAEQLIKENNLDFFAKGARSEKFASVGNDNGLFIIVEPNRNWYPTNRPATKHFTKVKFRNDKNLIQEITFNSLD